MTNQDPLRPPGEHIHFPEVSWPEPVTLQPRSRAHGERIAPTWAPGGIPDLPIPIADHAPWDGPIGMIEPRPDPTAALAALAEAEALAHALAATVPRRPTLLRRIVPTTATAFWMAAAFWLGFLLARAEGWL